MPTPGPRALLAGAGTGLLYTLSLPKADQGWLAWLCLLPVLLFLLQRPRPSPREAAVAGLTSGLVAGLGRVYWVAGTLERYGGLDAVTAAVTTALLVLYVAAYPTLFLALCRRLPATSHGWPWLTAALWSVLDWVQTWMISGFPWALLGYTQYRYTPLVLPAAVAGVHGVTFLIVLVNATVAQAITVHRCRRMGLLTAGLVLIAWIAVGYHRGSQLEAETRRDPVRAGIVQGNIGQDVKWLTSRSDSTTRHYARLTRDLARAEDDLDLIVWPETALPFVLDGHRHRRHWEGVQALARETATPLLVGSLGSRSPSGRTGLFNRSFLVDAHGEMSGSADKVHLVPFGEYLPFPWIFGYLRALTQQSGRFDPGDDHVVLPLPGSDVDLGVFICYESIFPSIPRTLVRGGAEILVNTTNDAWFGTSSAPEQHLAMAALRAVENGRSVVRAANTGISCIIDPQGQIRQATELFTTTSLTADVAPRTEITPYTRMGDWIFVLSAAVLVAAAALAERRRGREVHAEMEVARRELDTLARQPVPLRRPLVLLPGYDSGPHRWQSFRWHLGRCFTDAVEATWIDTARDASIAELASSSLEVLEAIGSPRDYVGHSLGALVAVQIAESGSRVVALAVPLEGSMWARIAGWARFAFPRQLRDLSPGSPALSQLRERVRQLPGWMGLRLSGDPLSGRPPVPLTGSHRDYQVPALMSPWSRHREVHADPRIIRDVIVALRSETLAEDA